VLETLQRELAGDWKHLGGHVWIGKTPYYMMQVKKIQLHWHSEPLSDTRFSLGWWFVLTVIMPGTMPVCSGKMERPKAFIFGNKRGFDFAKIPWKYRKRGRVRNRKDQEVKP